MNTNLTEKNEHQVTSPTTTRRKPTVLSKDDRLKLDAIIDKGPAAFGFDTPKWTYADLKQAIQKELGLSYSHGGLYGLLKKRGLTNQSQLSPAQISAISEVLKNDPRSYGFEKHWWTWQGIAKVMRDEMGISFGLHRVKKTLSEAGLQVGIPYQRISAAHYEEIKRAVGSGASNHGYPDDNWYAHRLVELVENISGVHFDSPGHLVAHLKEKGISSKIGRGRPKKAREEAAKDQNDCDVPRAS